MSRKAPTPVILLDEPKRPIATFLHQLNTAAEAAKTDEAEELLLGLIEAHPRIEKTSKGRMAWNTLLKAFANAGDVPGAERVHGLMRKRGLPLNSKHYGKLMEACLKANEPKKALEWLRREEREGMVDEVHYLLAVANFARSGDAVKAQELAEEFRQEGRDLPEVYVVRSICAGLAEGRHTDAVLELYRSKVSEYNAKLKREGPDAEDLLLPGFILEILSETDPWASARVLHKDLDGNGRKIDLDVYATVINNLWRLEDREAAWALFNRLVDLNIEPQRLFELDCLLEACAAAGDLEGAQWLFDKVLSWGIEPQTRHYGSIFKACERAQWAGPSTRIRTVAEKYFGAMITKGMLMSWSGMIQFERAVGIEQRHYLCELLGLDQVQLFEDFMRQRIEEEGWVDEEGDAEEIEVDGAEPLQVPDVTEQRQGPTVQNGQRRMSKVEHPEVQAPTKSPEPEAPRKWARRKLRETRVRL